MGILQPADDLPACFGFRFSAHGRAPFLENCFPAIRFLIGWRGAFEVLAPAVRVALQPAALAGRKPAHQICRGRGNGAGAFRHQRGRFFFADVHAVLRVLTGRKTGAIQRVDRLVPAHHRWILVVPRHERRGFLLVQLGERTRGHGVYGVAVHRIQRKRYFAIDAVALRAVLFLASDHGTLNAVAGLFYRFYHHHAALIACRCAAAAVQRPAGIRFVDTCMRIF